MKTIDSLVAELAPVRRIRPVHAWLLTAGLTGCAVLSVIALFGLRADISAGHPAGLVLLRGGLLLLLGSAALTALVTAARPGVGRTSQGWRWALCAGAIFPVATLVLALVQGELPLAELTSANGPWCLAIGGGSGLLIGAGLTAWLRKGAPVALNRAGWLVGLAAGSFGTFAYSLYCPSETLQYIGIWYSLAIGLCALTARLVVPGLLRW